MSKFTDERDKLEQLAAARARQYGASTSQGVRAWWANLSPTTKRLLVFVALAFAAGFFLALRLATHR